MRLAFCYTLGFGRLHVDTSQHEWVAFERTVNDMPMLHQCNVQFADGVPQGYPVRTIITFEFTPSDFGFPEESEYEAILELEDGIRDVMEEGDYAVHVGTVMGQGHRRLVFQCGNGEGTGARIQAISDSARAKVKWESEDDATWDFYRRVLLPSDRETMAYENSMVLQQMVEAGDNLEAPRSIEHLAYFRTTQAASAFSEWAVAAGFRVDAPEHPWDDEEFPHAVFFSKESPADLEEITEQSFAAMLAAEDLDGEYDGWQSSIVGGE